MSMLSTAAQFVYSSSFEVVAQFGLLQETQTLKRKSLITTLFNHTHPV